MSARAASKMPYAITADPRQLLANDWISYNLDTRKPAEKEQQERLEATLATAKKAILQGAVDA